MLVTNLMTQEISFIIFAITHFKFAAESCPLPCPMTVPICHYV